MRSVFFSPGSTQSLPCHTASGDNCTSSICPNTVVTYTCTITSGTAAGNTDWTLPTGTCPTNAFPDKIRLSQLVGGSCTAVVISTCGPYTASSIQSSDPIYCLSSILTVSITAAMNGSTVMCSNTNLITSSITTIVSMTTINVVGPPGHPNAVANTIGPDMVLVVVNPSSSGGLPTSYSVTISNSSYVYSNSTTAFLNGSAMVTFIGLTIGTNYTISAVAINCAGSSNSSNTTTIYVSWPAPTPSPPTSSASIISPTSAATAGPPGAAPNVVANTIGADMVLVVVNPSSIGGLPTSYNVTISNSSYMYGCRNSTSAFLNGSEMVTFTGLTNSTSYTISSTVLVQVTLPESMSYNIGFGAVWMQPIFLSGALKFCPSYTWIMQQSFA
eukprot:Em0006g369a